MKCPWCDSKVKLIEETYESPDGYKVLVNIPYCSKCESSWLPYEEEIRIDKEIEKQRKDAR